jgi:hypothetical protein
MSAKGFLCFLSAGKYDCYIMDTLDGKNIERKK